MEADEESHLDSFPSSLSYTGLSQTQIKTLVDALSPDQLARYEVYRRTKLPQAAVKRLSYSVLGQPIGQALCIILGGCGKVFVGEMVEGALEVMREENGSAEGDESEESGLQPHHLIEAYARYRRKVGLDAKAYKKRLF